LVEQGADAARQILADDEILAAPELVVAEVTTHWFSIEG
jgi:hypothetical protein